MGDINLFPGAFALRNEWMKFQRNKKREALMMNERNFSRHLKAWGGSFKICGAVSRELFLIQGNFHWILPSRNLNGTATLPHLYEALLAIISSSKQKRNWKSDSAPRCFASEFWKCWGKLRNLLFNPKLAIKGTFDGFSASENSHEFEAIFIFCSHKSSLIRFTKHKEDS